MGNAFQQKETKEAILDATDRLLARYGYKKMTIDDLAAEVGIGKGSVYLHFSSKEEIALSHIDRIIERLLINLKKIIGQNISCEEKLRRMLIERVLYRFDSVQHYTQSMNDILSALRPKLLERRENYFATEAQIFAEVLDEGKQKQVFGEFDSLSVAEIILTASNSLLPYSLSTQELGERSEIEAKTLRLADLLLNGLIRRKEK